MGELSDSDIITLFNDIYNNALKEHTNVYNNINSNNYSEVCGKRKKSVKFILPKKKKVKLAIRTEFISNKNYCEIESILSHQVENGKLFFLVKWKDNNEIFKTTYEPPEHLKHIFLFQQYCSKHDLII